MWTFINRDCPLLFVGLKMADRRVEPTGNHSFCFTLIILLNGCVFVIVFKLDHNREVKDGYRSDREGSATRSEDMTSSPCAQHNGSYKTRSREVAAKGAGCHK